MSTANYRRKNAGELKKRTPRRLGQSSAVHSSEHRACRIQIIYLPNQGAPVALCVIKDAKPDRDVTSQRVDDLNTATWRRAGLGYALIANSDDLNLSALGKQILDRSVDQLFGALDATLSATPFG